MNKKEILNVLSHGEVMIQDLKVDLVRNKIVTLQENQIKKIHYVAKERLRGFLKVCMLKSNHIYIISHL